MAFRDQIFISPAHISVGDCVCIEVKASSGKGFHHDTPGVVYIGGVPGGKQFLQFDRPGIKEIPVRLCRKGMPDQKELIRIEVAPSDDPLPFIRILQRLDSPLRVDFRLDYEPLTPPRHDRAGMLKRKPLEKMKRSLNSMVKARSEFVSPVHAGKKYVFDFGQGSRHRSSIPKASFDYADSMDNHSETMSFHVKVVIEEIDSKNLQIIQRTICIVNPYVVLKNKGFIMPLVTSIRNAVTVLPDNGRARNKGLKASTYYTAHFSCRNIEQDEITLTKMMIDSVFPGEHQKVSSPVIRDISMVIQPGEKKLFGQDVQLHTVLPGATGFVVYYSGQTASGKTVRISSYHDIPDRMKRHPEFLPKVIGESKVQMIKGKKVRPDNFGNSSPRSGVGPSMEGQPCNPYDLPDPLPENLVCQPTTETRETLIPGRFINAMKGDIILSPGSSSGFIARILRSVSPPQYYSHSCIMTKNQVEITHSTASEDRLTYEDYVGADGFEPDILRYLWPGVLTQSAQSSVYGDWCADPDDEEGHRYLITGFYPYQVSVDGMISPPLVIKPDPFRETPLIRERLSRIADFARTQAGKSHYRLYCYSNPPCALDPSFLAPSSSGWAAGTYPTVCSSFIWYCVRQAGGLFKMEGEEVERPDYLEGAEITEGSPDGLYRYTAEERLSAGEAIFSEIENKVELALLAQDILTSQLAQLDDMVEDCANQVTNTFATDWADGGSKDSDDWRNTTDALAVSPCNLLWYDPPLTGLYGYAEPLYFSSQHVEEIPVYEWKIARRTGTLKGKVVHNGSAIAGALVSIRSYPGISTHTDALGEFTIQDIISGLCEVEAFKENEPDPPWKTAEPKLEFVPEDGEVYCVLNIEGPNPDSRLVSLGVTILLKVYPPPGSASGIKSSGYIEEVFVPVQPGVTPPTAIVKHVVANITGEAEIHVQGHPDRSVTVTFRARMYDSDFLTEGWENSNYHSFEVPAEAERELKLRYINGDEITVYVNALNRIHPVG